MSAPPQFRRALQISWRRSETAADERPAEPEKVAALSPEDRRHRPPRRAEATAETPAAPVASRDPRCRCRSETRCNCGNTDAAGCKRLGPGSAGGGLRRRSKATPPRPGSPRSAAPLSSSTKGHRRIRTAAPSGSGHRSVRRERRRIAPRGARGWRAQATLTQQQQQPNPFRQHRHRPTPLLRFTR